MTARKASFPPVADSRARLLILGSLPGDRSLAERRYYAHPQNQFWHLLAPVVGPVLGNDLPALAYPDRLAALRDAGIALWDVIAHARRPGSTDAAIADPAANDLVGLIATLPLLTAIAFNGATAARHGRRALGNATTRLTLIDLPSSSPLHTVGIAAKRDAWSALARYRGCDFEKPVE